MVTLTDEEKRVRDILIDTASKEQSITYGDLIRKAKLPLDMGNPHHRTLFGRILGSISTYEHEAGRPLLSSITISKEYTHSKGFFNLAKELGYNAGNKEQWEEFAIQEMKKAHEYWSKAK